MLDAQAQKRLVEIRAKHEAKRAQREEFYRARKSGLKRRHYFKLQRLKAKVDAE